MADDTNVQVVDASGGNRHVGMRHVLAILMTAVLVAGGTYWLWSSDADGTRTVLVAEPVTETDDAASTTTETTLDITTSSTDPATTMPPSSTSDTTEPGGGYTNDPSEENNPEYCSWKVPNLVGRTFRETAGLFTGCLSAHAFGSGPQVGFEFHTAAELCTTDPALYDVIAAQTPSPGTPFGGGIVRFDLTYYRDCSITTTTIPGPLITPPPVTDPPTTDTEPPTP